MNLRFLPAAREELDAAASYLEDRVAGLGGEFLDDVERTGTLLCQFPCCVFVEPGRGSMIEINWLRLASAQLRVVQPHR
jgi:hypothetical protein